MKDLLVLRNKLYNFVGKYEVYVKPVCKLILALVVFSVINGSLGYMEKIDSFAIVMIAALLCSFMPLGFITFLAAVFLVLHLYALSLEVAIVGGVLFLILFLLYFRLSPKDSLTVLGTPILSAIGIPYVLPISLGLVSGPASAASIGCGVIISHFLERVKEMAPGLMAMSSEDMSARLRYIIDGILEDKTMIVLIVAFAITIIVVYIISQFSFNYSWTIAIGAGGLVQLMSVLIVQAFVDANISVGGLLIGTILGILVGLVVEFFKYNVDYKRTEKVHFEDDEYHYYVKAIPKRGVVAGQKNQSKRRPVNRNNSNNRRPQTSSQNMYSQSQNVYSQNDGYAQSDAYSQSDMYAQNDVYAQADYVQDDYQQAMYNQRVNNRPIGAEDIDENSGEFIRSLDE
ncbi:MAG: hypothetical protein MJ133_03585 [Lachnospiraceae bacterium]|nr:hypothetical protein [Lachnospiraceae bacterium]